MAYCKAASAWAPDGNEDEARTSSETISPHLAKLFADAEATDEAGDPARLPGEGVDVAFTWRVENFAAFRDVLETRKIFSEYFTAGAKRLRIGAYESYDTLCVYLESEKAPATAAKSGKKKDAPVPPPEKGKEKPPGFETDEPDAKKKKKGDEKGSSDPEGTLGSDPDRNYWVRYRVAVLNQKHPERTQWKEGAVCTKTWNTQVLQFKSVDDVLDPENGSRAEGRGGVRVRDPRRVSVVRRPERGGGARAERGPARVRRARGRVRRRPRRPPPTAR